MYVVVEVVIAAESCIHGYLSMAGVGAAAPVVIEGTTTTTTTTTTRNIVNSFEWYLRSEIRVISFSYL